MRPAEARDDTGSAAERSIFERLRADLDDSWIALHSLGLVSHPKKPWAELDFVLIGPPGVFCLEVKGQLVSRRDGKWIFTNRNGVESVKQEGPFEQVATATAALTHYIFDRLPPVRRSVIGYGVVMPDLRFDLEGPDIEPGILYDSRDTDLRFSEYVTRLVKHWTDRIHLMKGTTPRLLEPSEVNAVMELLRPDFDARPSLRGQANQINRELLRMTHEQYRIIDGLHDNERAFIRGGAGTGKTLLAIEEAKRQAALGRTVFLCCFNRNLSEFTAVATRQNSKITCRNLHGFMAAMVTRAGLRDELPAASEADLFAVFYPELCVRAMAADPTFKPFDVLIVDESQDLLRDAYLDVFDRVLDGGLAGGRWRMFFDPRQNLFDGTESEALQRVLRCAPAQFNLSVNCRNTAAVATATGLLADTVCDETLISEGPEVVTLWYSDENEAMDVLRAELRRLTAGGVQARDIVILSARTFEQSGISENLAKEFRISEAPTSQGGIRFATASAFKGLEADAILVIGIDELNTPSTHKSLYVSTSRARVFLSVFLNRRARSEYEDLGRKFGQRLSAGSAGTPGMAAR